MLEKSFIYRDIDVFVENGSEKFAVEVESLSGTKDVVHAVQNAAKALKLAGRLEIVVKNRQVAERLKRALMQSPLKNDREINPKLLAHLASIEVGTEDTRAKRSPDRWEWS
jgi:hypothetical protein